MDSVMNKLLRNIEIQEQLVADTEYIDWLCEFTETYRRFTDTYWLYEKDEISMLDNENVNNLTNFFTAIDNYCSKNLLEANQEGIEAWYNIKYKDVYFAIGVGVGQGVYNFVIRYESHEDMLPEPFIDFDYIMQDKTAPGVEQKQAKLQELEKLLDEMKDIGVPENVVKATVNHFFSKDS